MRKEIESEYSEQEIEALRLIHQEIECLRIEKMKTEGLYTSFAKGQLSGMIFLYNVVFHENFPQLNEFEKIGVDI